MITPQPFIVECRGPADWVQIDQFSARRHANAFIRESIHEDSAAGTVWRWEYRVREKRLDGLRQTAQDARRPN